MEDLDDMLADAQKFMDYLKNADEDELAFIWRIRNNLHKQRPYKARSMLWDELEYRYEHLERKPITLRLPYFYEIDASNIKTEVFAIIRNKPWPEFVKEWHCKNMKLVTQSAQHISEILCNVTKPWQTHNG